MNSALSSMLISQLWQVTLLAVVVWLVARLFAKNRPHLAHALWLLVLLKCITPPIWSSPTSPFSWMQIKTPAGMVQGDDLTNEKNTNVFDNSTPMDDTIIVNVDRSQGSEEARQSDWSAEHLPQRLSANNYDTGSIISQIRWGTGLWILWLGGAGIGLVITLIRICWFLHWTRRRQVCTESDLCQAVDDLRRQLGIKRRVSIRVIDRPVGPAVLGLFRPTILLPTSIVSGREHSQLEPMLAHELVHIRRGDLWWAMVQTLAGCLFWFHPLVRLAVQMVTRESERSCDEETVASLGCSPASYARGLLEVLEQKQRLRVGPALPGIRPVDITSARLERVMKLGNGSHRRTPLWVWAVMLVCSAMVLPGAALVFGQGESLPLVQLPHASFQSTDGTLNWRLESHAVGDLLAKIDKAGNTDLKPSVKLIRMLPCRFPDSNSGSCTPRGRCIEFLTVDDDGKQRAVRLGDSEPTMKVVKDTLYVYGTDTEHENVDSTLKRVRKHGYRQVVVEVRFITGDPQAWKDFEFDWRNVNGETEDPKISAVQTIGAVTTKPEAFDAVKYVQPEFAKAARATNLNPGDEKQGHTFFPDINQVTQIESVENADSAQPDEATAGLQRQLTAKYSVINSQLMQQIIERAKQDVRINVSQAPTISMYDGQSGVVKDALSQPFVIGVDSLKIENSANVVLQPKIGIVEDGITVKVNPEIQLDGTIQLNGQLMISQIAEVQEYSFNHEDAKNENGEPQNVTIQVPVVAVNGVRADATVPDGGLVAISTELPSIKNNEKTKTMLVLMRCVVVNEPPSFVQTVLPTPQLPISAPVDVGVSPILRNANVNLSLQAAPEQADSPVVNDAGIIIIRSLDDSASTDVEPILQRLEGLDVSLQLETDVEMQMIADGLRIRGENLLVFSKDGAFRLSGVKGEFELRRDNRFALKFSGGAKVVMDEDFQVSADSIEHSIDNDKVTFSLQGNARMVSEGFELRSDRIWMENENVVLEGDACLKRKLPDGSQVETSGEKIKWNFDTNELGGVSGQEMPASYFIGDDIQYFPSGPEFRLTREAAALKRARGKKEK